MLLPSLGNINYNVAYIFRKYADLDGNNRTYRLGWEEIAH